MSNSDDERNTISTYWMAQIKPQFEPMWTLGRGLHRPTRGVPGIPGCENVILVTTSFSARPGKFAIKPKRSGIVW